MFDIDGGVGVRARSRLGQARSKVTERGKAQRVLSDMLKDVKELSHMVQRLRDPYNGNTKRKARRLLSTMLEDMKELSKWCND